MDVDDDVETNLSALRRHDIRVDVGEYEVGSTKMRKYGLKRLRQIAGVGAGLPYFVFNSTLRNLVDAITKRVYLVRSGQGLVPPPKPVDGAVSVLDTIRTQLVDAVVRPSVVQVGDYAKLYTGPRYNLYKRAADNVLRGNIPARDRVFKGFLKMEPTLEKSGKPAVARMITAATPEYNVLTGRYLKNLEPALAKAFHKVAGYPVICKGYNARQVARKLRTDWDTFSDPVAVGLDASRFDQHVSVEMLKWEFSVYDAIFGSAELSEYLTWQIEPTVLATAADGWVRYKGSGRCSGVINTGMGNCLIMSSLVLTWARVAGVRMRLSNNGDDCVCIMEKRDLATFTRNLTSWFTKRGFTLEVEEPVDVFERIEFCQAQPVWADGWVMTRNPFKHTDKDTATLVGWDSEADVDAWRRAVSEGGRSLNAGVPFWFDWYSRLGAGSENADTRYSRVTGQGRWMDALKGLKPREHFITPEARHSFWLAYGILPDAQIALENMRFEVVSARPVVKSGPLNQPPLHQLLTSPAIVYI